MIEFRRAINGSVQIIDHLTHADPQKCFAVSFGTWPALILRNAMPSALDPDWRWSSEMLCHQLWTLTGADPQKCYAVSFGPWPALILRNAKPSALDAFLTWKCHQIETLIGWTPLYGCDSTIRLRPWSTEHCFMDVDMPSDWDPDRLNTALFTWNCHQIETLIDWAPLYKLG